MLSINELQAKHKAAALRDIPASALQCIPARGQQIARGVVVVPVAFAVLLKVDLLHTCHFVKSIPTAVDHLPAFQHRSGFVKIIPASVDGIPAFEQRTVRTGVILVSVQFDPAVLQNSAGPEHIVLSVNELQAKHEAAALRDIPAGVFQCIPARGQQVARGVVVVPVAFAVFLEVDLLHTGHFIKSIPAAADHLPAFQILSVFIDIIAVSLRIRDPALILLGLLAGTALDLIHLPGIRRGRRGLGRYRRGGTGRGSCRQNRLLGRRGVGRYRRRSRSRSGGGS